MCKMQLLILPEITKENGNTPDAGLLMVRYSPSSLLLTLGTIEWLFYSSVKVEVSGIHFFTTLIILTFLQCIHVQCATVMYCRCGVL